MDSPSFDGLRIALEDADARVRIEDQIPQAVPRILGIHIDGGFLSGQVIQFSPNLSCIIGGRGTGKSTAFEAVRCIIEGRSDSTVVDSEAWPDELHIVWEDQAGQQHTLFRPKDSKEPRPSRRGFCKPRGNLPPLRYGLPFLPALPSGASWQIFVTS